MSRRSRLGMRYVHFGVALALLWCALPLSAAELNEQFRVEVADGSDAVSESGSYLVRVKTARIPVGDSYLTFLYRARTTNAVTGEQGMTTFFELAEGQVKQVAEADFDFLNVQPAPVRVGLTAPEATMTAASPLQLTATATLPDGTTVDVTPRLMGTTYATSNSAVLSVSPDGLLTAQPVEESTQVTVMAANETIVTSVQITVEPECIDCDGDGIPGVWERLYGFSDQDPADASLDGDSDGFTNLQEYQAGTNPLREDTDSDGLLDGVDPEPLIPETEPPQVTIIEPTEGSNLYSIFLTTVTGTAFDNASVERVHIYTGDTFLTSVVPDAQGNFSASVRLPTYPTFTTISAVASDKAGNEGSDAVSVIVEQGGIQSQIVDISSNGVQGTSASWPAISGGGRYVAFWSASSVLVPGDTNGVPDYFVRDMDLGITERVTLTAGGAQSFWFTNFVQGPDISDDGRYVGYAADHALVAGDTGDNSDIYVYDRQNDVPELISIGLDGTAKHSDTFTMSADGQVVAFLSGASGLTNDPRDSLRPQYVFVRDRRTQTTVRVNREGTTVGSNYGIGPIKISADGTVVAWYVSDVAKGTHAYDVSTGQDVLLTHPVTGGVLDVRPAAVSPGGSLIYFNSNLNDLDVGGGDYLTDVFAWDWSAGTIVKAIPDAAIGTLNSTGSHAIISQNGYAYLYRMANGAMVRIDVNMYGDTISPYAVLRVSGDGSYVASGTSDPNMVENDANSGYDTFRTAVSEYATNN